MAEVTGLTADRMVEIENKSIVAGTIINGRLILTAFDGETSDAGRVLGVERVFHGTNPNTARPSGAPIVYWIGSADPVNAQAWDFLLKENINDPGDD